MGYNPGGEPVVGPELWSISVSKVMVSFCMPEDLNLGGHGNHPSGVGPAEVRRGDTPCEDDFHFEKFGPSLLQGSPVFVPPPPQGS